ncbi:c-type cytochrome [Roseibium sediminicola]|uniref:C-type cytochrome n=1 Tax=Roseibium sediminicola TaxID=2933272 RepID=A0ABT0GSF8_9HYPH|nr:c-type cytochrome [Roseibium sp. CAU 1639]MCK7612374.1 c-type cytochrome [Roseibium sp. CAU 1639]
MTRAVTNSSVVNRRNRAAVPAIAALVMGLLTTEPALAGDPAAGKALALQWCSACHLVAEDQAVASSVSLPSFYDMAKDPDWSEEKLATFLANPHPQMPNMSLGNTEIANLAAYIGSLAP